MTPVKQKKRFNGAGENTKKDELNLVLSPPKADVFVMKSASDGAIKDKEIIIKHLRGR
jgi:hypothetical protein